ncbi:multicopper oxidase [Amanita muscaria Koide BX008]|uniref:Multicopper oxidase n=1 Tax=Amanita muscaria (strain Koide BX008) TaxID=946122 RepID=A0A0C2WUB6_AMAMK|nr:multicopper oxidase [Amanita muscaria Koide BX008]
MLTSALIIATLIFAVNAAIGPVTDLHIVNKVIAPDGFSRSTVISGATPDTASTPGPLVIGKKGDQFRINVINSLHDRSMLTTTSIHWHGIYQGGSSWADGPVGVTQCPITPGNSFLYEFTVPDQAGTFWYHSHHSTQYCDGLRGPLVVYDDDDPHKSLYDVDDESTVITLSEWYHPPSPSQGLIPVYDSILVNGVGRYIGGPASPLAIVNVSQGTRYRIRLLSLSCDPHFSFSIDNHIMTVIEVDGVSTQPLTVDSIDIFAGQRYSFILNANQAVGNYWIRAVPVPPPIGLAILRYAGAPNAEPRTLETPSVRPLIETDLVPLQNSPAPGAPYLGGADINLVLNITTNVTTGQYYINGASFTPPTVPVLLQILSGARRAQELLPSGSVYVLPRNKVVEVSIPGGSDQSPHPFHLHGQNFAVIRSANSPALDFAHPVIRDVVNTGVIGDNVTFRFTTDNPGPWFLHCHIDWHLQLGLAIVFVTDSDATAESRRPAAWDQLCPIYNQSGLP